MYSWGGGTFGAHGWIPECTHIGRLSYAAVQVYLNHHSPLFWAIHTGGLATFTFALISSHEVLCILAGSYSLRNEGQILDLDIDDYNMYYTQLTTPSIVSQFGILRQQLSQIGQRSAQN
jgi:hypothetical protein